jgi:beta-glucosidase
MPLKIKYRSILQYVLLAICILFFVQARIEPTQYRSHQQDTTRTIHQKVDSLLALMTLKEKAGQLTIIGGDHKNLDSLVKNGLVGGTNGMLPGKENPGKYLKNMQKLAMQSRLKIPLLFMGDIVHGYRTSFPVPLAEASSWNPRLVRATDSVSAVEATAAGMNWTFAPIVDIARDPRWGRNVEGVGEDPDLGSVFAAAAVHGFQQGNLADPQTMAATTKHFAGYGAVEAGRAYNTVDMSERRLHQIYLPPFKAAIDVGVATVMPAFISLNGIPASENVHLLHDILRSQLGFHGLTVSDYDAVPELVNHKVARNERQAVKEAINAGMDMDLHSGTYLKYLPQLVKSGAVSKKRLNEAVRRVLRLKFKLGLFDHPFQYGSHSNSFEDTLLARHRPLARKAGDQSIVLLKNNQHMLPLSKNIKKLAVIGPLARDQKDLLGPVHALGRPEEAISTWQGIKEAVSSRTKLIYAKGTGSMSTDTSGFADAVSAAKRADAVVMVMGESAGMSGEADSRSMLGLPGNQLNLVKKIVKTGKPVVVVLMSGRPLTIPWLDKHVNSMLESWFLGTEAGHSIADVLFGDYNPSGKLTVTFPRNVGQIPLYYNHLNTARPKQPGQKYTSRYIDVANTPLYPFGYGLSYTTFSYSNLQLSDSTIDWNDTLKISCKVTNTGDRTGTEIAQLYTQDVVASISPPVKVLNDFRRLTLKPGESATVTFKLNRHDLAFYGKKMNNRAEPGDFKVFVGGSSVSVKQARFTLKAPEE